MSPDELRDIPVHDNAREEIEQGKCSVLRFGGQTHVYIPRIIADQVGYERIQELAIECYGLESLNNIGQVYGGWHKNRRTHVSLRLPTATKTEKPIEWDEELEALFNENPTEIFPHWNEPQTLVDKILACLK